MNKKILLIVIIVIIAIFILLSIKSFRFQNLEFHETPHETIEQEQVVTTTDEQNVTQIDTALTTSTHTDDKITNKQTVKEYLNPVKKILQIKNEPIKTTVEKEEKVVEEVVQTAESTVTEGRKFTPEEEEALKKVPTSKVVVVDKEIKLKSSGKYRFR